MQDYSQTVKRKKALQDEVKVRIGTDFDNLGTKRVVVKIEEYVKSFLIVYKQVFNEEYKRVLNPKTKNEESVNKLRYQTLNEFLGSQDLKDYFYTENAELPVLTFTKMENFIDKNYAKEEKDGDIAFLVLDSFSIACGYLGWGHFILSTEYEKRAESAYIISLKKKIGYKLKQDLNNANLNRKGLIIDDSICQLEYFKSIKDDILNFLNYDKKSIEANINLYIEKSRKQIIDDVDIYKKNLFYTVIESKKLDLITIEEINIYIDFNLGNINNILIIDSLVFSMLKSFDVKKIRFLIDFINKIPNTIFSKKSIIGVSFLLLKYSVVEKKYKQILNEVSFLKRNNEFVSGLFEVVNFFKNNTPSEGKIEKPISNDFLYHSSRPLERSDLKNKKIFSSIKQEQELIDMLNQPELFFLSDKLYLLDAINNSKKKAVKIPTILNSLKEEENSLNEFRGNYGENNYNQNRFDKLIDELFFKLNYSNIFFTILEGFKKLNFDILISDLYYRFPYGRYITISKENLNENVLNLEDTLTQLDLAHHYYGVKEYLKSYSLLKKE